MLLGVDTGGTFTDFVLLRDGIIRVHKVLSTPDAPERAILTGIEQLQLLAAAKNNQLCIIHGSTVATNAALEGKGVRTAFVSNAGFKDMLTIGRQTREELYNLQPAVQKAAVARELCFEIDCRVDANGKVVKALSTEALEKLAAEIKSAAPQAIAINLLFSYLRSEEEEKIAELLSLSFSDTLFISLSSTVLPEYKEYERGIATWLNAYLGPLIEKYLANLESAVSPAPLAIMQSSGGTISAKQASQRAVNLLLSGPAGGLAAAKYFKQFCDTEGLLTFDMGGTSTDVALVQEELSITNEGKIGRYPVATPMVDMHTIGAGGGSIAYIDEGGLLQVGPQSAGARPGPVCYGLGGKEATVTDANAVLGRLPENQFLGGTMSLNISLAKTAIAELAENLELSISETALGIIQIANEHMARALRVMSVQRGHNPAHFHLCCFGGAGGLHVCELAELLGMRKILIPQFGGVLSAFGMLVAPRERQYSKTRQSLLNKVQDKELKFWLQDLAELGQKELVAEGNTKTSILIQPSLDLRYQGQSYTINIPYDSIEKSAEKFHQEHLKLYGHQLKRDLELVNIRQRVYCLPESIELPEIPLIKNGGTAASPDDSLALFGIGDTAIYKRSNLQAGTLIIGPALICETISTTLLQSGWKLEVDRVGNLLLEKL
ncbi:hydantoinase/oxoprolinase family protein [Aurantivibrio infirmus]